jgi:hypothetical protein
MVAIIVHETSKSMGGKTKKKEVIAPLIHKRALRVHFHKKTYSLWHRGTHTCIFGAFSYKNAPKLTLGIATVEKVWAQMLSIVHKTPCFYLNAKKGPRRI